MVMRGFCEGSARALIGFCGVLRGYSEGSERVMQGSREGSEGF